jgi:hypothetical protein
MPKSNGMSFRLSDEAKRILVEAESRLGLKRSATVEQALRIWAWDQYKDMPKESKKKSRKSS